MPFFFLTHTFLIRSIDLTLHCVGRSPMLFWKRFGRLIVLFRVTETAPNRLRINGWSKKGNYHWKQIQKRRSFKNQWLIEKRKLPSRAKTETKIENENVFKHPVCVAQPFIRNITLKRKSVKSLPFLHFFEGLERKSKRRFCTITFASVSRPVRISS